MNVYNTFEKAFSSQEFKFFNFFQTQEKGLDALRPDPLAWLESVAPGRAYVLKNALKKIKFKFNGIFIVDLLMPMNVGGYYTPGRKPPILAISPMLLLYGSESQIAHVLFHEGLHAGIYTDGVPLMEEVVVETMTKKKMDEVYGKNDFASGYDGMVKEVAEYFGELSFSEMQERIEDGDEETFNNLLELIVVEPAFNSKNIQDFRWERIQGRLKKKWDMILRLFPRMVNTIADNNRGLHESGAMSFYSYKLEGLLNATAERIIEKEPQKLVEIMLELTKNGEEIENIEEKLIKEGFAYLFDFDRIYMQKAIQIFKAQILLLQMNGEEVNKEVIVLV